MVHLSSEDAEKYFFEMLLNSNDYTEGAYIAGLHIMLPKTISKIDVLLYPFVFNMIKCFLEIDDETREPNEIINKILIHNIQEILQSSSLHKKTLKRFVKEYFADEHEEIRLNTDSSNKRTLFLFYVLFVIGKDNIENIDDNSLQKIVKEALGKGIENKFVMTDDIEKKLQNEILATEGYSKFLEKGAEVIKNGKISGKIT